MSTLEEEIFFLFGVSSWNRFARSVRAALKEELSQAEIVHADG